LGEWIHDQKGRKSRQLLPQQVEQIEQVEEQWVEQAGGFGEGVREQEKVRKQG
jgi:hypothetical protein